MAVVEVVTPPEMSMMTMGGSSRNGKEVEVEEEEQAQVFLDFLGPSMKPPPPPPPVLRSTAGASAASGAQRGAASATSSALLYSERQGVKGSEIFHFHGRKTAISGHEEGNIFSGRKRSNSESARSGLMDRELPGQSKSKSLENSCMIKMFGKELPSEQPGKSHTDDEDDGDITFSMPRQPNTSPMLLHHPLGRIPDPPISNHEKSLSQNPARLLYPSRFSQAGTFSSMLSSSYMNKHVSQVATVITQPIVDEGSGTSINGSRAVTANYPSRMACQRDSTGFLVPRLNASHSKKSESSSVVRYQHCRNHILDKQTSEACAGRQMTIFYSGQAYVFDSVHPKKADVIMALAGSNGGSWSTTYSPKSSEQTSRNEDKVATPEKMQMGKSPLLANGDMVHETTREEVPVAIDLSGVKSGDYHKTRMTTAGPNVGDKRDAGQAPL